MSWQEPEDERFGESGDPEDRPESWGDPDCWDPDAQRWPLDWHGLYPRERWVWFEQLWTDVCMLRERYRLPVRSGWWDDGLQVEALAALASWVGRYDSGEWDDPPGKLALLYDLERVSQLLREGFDPFDPVRDAAPFHRFLIDIGCRPPP